MKRVRTILQQTGALDGAIARAYEFSDQAQSALDALPDSHERDALMLLARFAVDRTL